MIPPRYKLSILLFLFSSFSLKAQTDSVIIGECLNYEDGQFIDTTITIDTFDITTGLILSSTSGEYIRTYSYNQYNLPDTITDTSPLMTGRAIYFYTTFLKDSIIIGQMYASSTWTNTNQRIYTYDSLQRILTITYQNWNISFWETYYISYYTYNGNNLDNILTYYPMGPDSALQVYTYDTLGNYQVSNFQWVGNSWDTLVETGYYNAQGQPLSYETDQNFREYQYDSLGNLTGYSYSSSMAFAGISYYYMCSGWLHSSNEYYLSCAGNTSSECNYYYLGSSPIYIALEQNHAICSGDTIHFNDSLIVGSPPVSYSWSPSAGLSSDTILNPDAFPDSTTTYYLTAIDSLGNIFTGCVLIVINQTPQIAITSIDTTSICYGDTVHLLASSDISTGFYRWYRSGVNYQSNYDSSSVALQTGDYYVQISTASGCSNTSDTISVYVDNSVQTNLSVNTTSCLGDTARLAANPLNAPYKNYQWVLDSIPVNGATDSVLFTTTPGTYYLIVTSDTSSCVYSTNPVNIMFSPQPTPGITPTSDTSVCISSGNVVLKITGDTTWNYGYYLNGSYQNWPNWDPDSIVYSIYDSTYLFVVASNNGCIGYSDTILITAYPYFFYEVLADPPSPYCDGDTVVLSTSFPSSAGYQWNTGSIDSITYAYSSGNYNVTIIDSNGCNAGSGIMLTFNSPPPLPVISQNGPELSSTTAFTMQWYLNGTMIPGATNNTYTPLINGNYTYEITDSAGCSSMSLTYNFTTALIDKKLTAGEIFIYPQVTESDFEIFCPPATIIQSVELEIYSVTGENIFSKRLSDPITKITAIHFPNGIYFWKVSGSEGELQSGKILFAK